MDNAPIVLSVDMEDVSPEQLAAAHDAGLRYVIDDEPGYSRLPFG